MVAVPRRGRGRATAFAVALALLFVLMRFPGHPDGFTAEHLLRLPLELPLVLLALVLLPRERTRAPRLLLVAALSLLLLLRLGDIGSRLAFGRAFSPLAEFHLVGQGWTLASGTVGRAEAAFVVTLALTLLVLTGTGLYRGLGSLASFTDRERHRIGALSAALLAAGALALLVEAKGGPDLGVRADVSHELLDRVRATRRAVRDQVEFSTLIADDPVGRDENAPGFAALDGLDVIVLFVESYGRSYLDAERFAPDARADLLRIESELAGAGLVARSAWLDSPVRGGRSWLAQATLASGVPLTNHARFQRLLGSDRRSLHTLFADAGWRTAAVLPIVDGAWVEGSWYGVERFFDRGALGYAGTSFGYVPMPDQYTLSAFQRHVREGEAGRRPLMASVGLLDSHAPWTPLPLPVPWETIGDGRVFDGTRRFGGPLDWARPEPVRTMYGLAVGATLARIGEYLVRYGRDALFVVVGDHQPAGVIGGWSGDANVPVHLVASDPAVLARLPGAHFAWGMLPEGEAPVLPMAAVRELLASVFERPLSDDGVRGRAGENLCPPAGP